MQRVWQFVQSTTTENTKYRERFFREIQTLKIIFIRKMESHPQITINQKGKPII